MAREEVGRREGRGGDVGGLNPFATERISNPLFGSGGSPGLRGQGPRALFGTPRRRFLGLMTSRTDPKRFVVGGNRAKDSQS